MNTETKGTTASQILHRAHDLVREHGCNIDQALKAIDMERHKRLTDGQSEVLETFQPVIDVVMKKVAEVGDLSLLFNTGAGDLDPENNLPDLSGQRIVVMFSEYEEKPSGKKVDAELLQGVLVCEPDENSKATISYWDKDLKPYRIENVPHVSNPDDPAEGIVVHWCFPHQNRLAGSPVFE